MYTEIDKNMAIKFLRRNYPVSRVKINNKFKRAIILNNGETYLLSDKNAHKELKEKLLTTLAMAFNFDETFSRNILNNFLPL